MSSSCQRNSNNVRTKVNCAYKLICTDVCAQGRKMWICHDLQVKEEDVRIICTLERWIGTYHGCNVMLCPEARTTDLDTREQTRTNENKGG